VKTCCSLGDGRPVHVMGMCVACARAFNKWRDRANVVTLAHEIAWAARRALKLAEGRNQYPGGLVVRR